MLREMVIDDIIFTASWIPRLTAPPALLQMNKNKGKFSFTDSTSDTLPEHSRYIEIEVR